MKKLQALTATFLITSLLSCNSQSTDNNRSEIESKPNESQNLMHFIPEGYALLDSVSGNLNLDDITDFILVLKRADEEEVSDINGDLAKRPLILLLGQGNGRYEKVAESDNTVYCYACGGMMGDPYGGIFIENGGFKVEYSGGSSDRWTRIVTYRYSEEEDYWLLYEDRADSFSSFDPEKGETDIWTVKDFGKVRFEEFDIYADQ